MFRLKVVATREDVLRLLSEEQIFDMYGITPTNKLFCNPFRSDRNPTCSFYRNSNNILKFKDFGVRDWNLDCFALVAKIYNISYYSAIQKVYNDYIKGKTPRTSLKVLESISIDSESKKHLIEIRKRRFNKNDLNYWNSHGITMSSINKYDVHCSQWVKVNKNLIYTHSNYSPSYAYYLGKSEIENSLYDDFKVYFPRRKKMRFVSNTSKVQGHNQLPNNGNHLVIQKSLKDVMLLNEYGINSIAFNGETVKPNQSLLDEYKSRFNNLYVWYDNDEAGREGASYFESLGITKLENPEGTPKDATDYYKSLGKKSFELNQNVTMLMKHVS